MLLTVTPNPALDRTLDVPRLRVGQVHRAVKVRLAAGGKGLNAARAALTQADEVLATAPLAGHIGHLVADLAAAEGLPAEWYWLQTGLTRTCVLINHSHLDATVINEPGYPVSSSEWRDFIAHVESLVARAKAVIFSGSLPPGVDAETYGDLIGTAAIPARPIYVDTSGAALKAILARPKGLCLKVNRAELAAGLKMQLDDIGQTIEAGQIVLARGASLLVVTLGGAGALALGQDGGWLARPPAVQVVSSVGSGDAFLAGLALAGMAGQSVPEAARMGVAYGTANATTALPGRFEPELVTALLGQIEIRRVG